MQLAIDFDTPALPVAQAMGEIGMKRALDHAEADEPGFSERAQAFVLEYLRVHGVSSGELITEIRDFTGLRFGNITPTDIDGFLEFNDRIFIFIEGKRTGAPLSNGQALALARLADAIHCPPRRYAVTIIIDHEPTVDDIDYANATVRAYRWGGQWRKLMQAGITLRAAIDRFIAMANKPSLRVVSVRRSGE